jgi:hypothetical protein
MARPGHADTAMIGMGRKMANVAEAVVGLASLRPVPRPTPTAEDVARIRHADIVGPRRHQLRVGVDHEGEGAVQGLLIVRCPEELGVGGSQHTADRRGIGWGCLSYGEALDHDGFFASERQQSRTNIRSRGVGCEVLSLMPLQGRGSGSGLWLRKYRMTSARSPLSVMPEKPIAVPGKVAAGLAMKAFSSS